MYENKFHRHWKKKAQNLQKNFGVLRATHADTHEGAIACCQARPTAHSNSVTQVAEYMKRLQLADWVSIMMGVLARTKSICPTDDQPFMIYDVPDVTAFEPMLRRIVDMRDLEIRDHVEECILTPARVELLGLLGQLSNNRLDWANSLYKIDHSARTVDGERLRFRQLLAPDSKQQMPEHMGSA